MALKNADFRLEEASDNQGVVGGHQDMRPLVKSPEVMQKFPVLNTPCRIKMSVRLIKQK